MVLCRTISTAHIEPHQVVAAHIFFPFSFLHYSVLSFLWPSQPLLKDYNSLRDRNKCVILTYSFAQLTSTRTSAMGISLCHKVALSFYFIIITEVTSFVISAIYHNSIAVLKSTPNCSSCCGYVFIRLKFPSTISYPSAVFISSQFSHQWSKKKKAKKILIKWKFIFFLIYRKEEFPLWYKKVFHFSVFYLFTQPTISFARDVAAVCFLFA